MTILNHSLHSVARAAEQRLRPAIAAVTDPSCEAKLLGPSYRPGAIPDALHAPRDKHTDGNDVRQAACPAESVRKRSASPMVCLMCSLRSAASRSSPQIDS